MVRVSLAQLLAVGSLAVQDAVSTSAGSDNDAVRVSLKACLELQNLSELDAVFNAVSDPANPEYLNFIEDPSALAAQFGAPDEKVEEVVEWITQTLGCPTHHIRVSAARDTVTCTSVELDQAILSDDNQLLTSALKQEQQPPNSVEFLVAHPLDQPSPLVVNSTDLSGKEEAATSYRLRRIQELYGGAGESSSPDSFYTVANTKKAYGIPVDLQAKSDNSSQMVWGPGTFGYSKSELDFFKAENCPLLNTKKVVFDTKNHGTEGGDNFGEGNLDVEMIAAFGLNIMTVVSNTNTSSSTEEGNGFGGALLDFVTDLYARDTVPHILSMSLGSLSAASCDLLCSKIDGHSLEECNAFLQKQRQVCMFLSQDQVARIHRGFQMLGLRGVTVLGASGDGGSHFSFEPFSGGAIATALNKVSCDYQMPVFPTSSPYVLSVGGEEWEGGNMQKPTAWGGSGGGFSWQFDALPHQKSVVENYLHTTHGLPAASSFNASGRAYPDVAAISIDGTSQSCPTVAGIFSLLIDYRLQNGLKGLGFVAPRLYQVNTQFPGEAFQDIPTGNTKTTCSNGFPATNSWDPVTGWGRPQWAGLLKHFGTDNATAATYYR